METPLSPNWPAAWIGVFTLALSPLKAVLLPRVPEAWRYTAAAILAYAFTAIAAALTPLEATEVAVQGGIILGLVLGGYVAARSTQGLVTGLAGAGVGAGIGGGLAVILPAALAQDSTTTTVAGAAKDAAATTAKFWIAWALSLVGGKIGRWIDGKRGAPRPA